MDRVVRTKASSLGVEDRDRLFPIFEMGLPMAELNRLRGRIIQHMAIRNLSWKVQLSYLHAVTVFRCRLVRSLGQK